MRQVFTIALLMIASFCLGRAAYKKSLDSCTLEMIELRKTKKALTENLLECWNELPLGCIREGDVAK